MRSIGSDDRRGTGRSGGLLATAVVLGTGVAAVGVRAAAGAPLRGVGPAARDAVWLAVLFAFAAVLTAAKYSDHLRSTESASTAQDRLRQATLTVLLASAALVPVALLLLHPSTGKAVPKKPSTPYRSPARTPGKASGSSFNLRAFLLVVLIAISVLALVWLIAAVIRMLRTMPTPSPAASGSLIEPPQTQDESLAGALLAGRSALSGDDARTAIVACYAAMETSLNQAGVIREQSDSPSDLLRRAAARDLPGADTHHAETLTTLFREARFSTHPMT
ncbi:MAG: DUF4129 domain-containing protein, partial [Actinocrinis sp.]